MSDIPSAPTPVLVLGATSLVGRFLLPLASERGLPLVALSRAPPRAANWLKGDLGDADLARGLPPVSAVVSLSPVWLLPPALEALRQAGMRRLVAFSSTSRVTKAASPDPGERDVARRLAEGEEGVAAFCAAHGIAWTLLRPTLIYAEGLDRNVSRLAGLIARFRVLPISGRGQGLRQPVHAADLAQIALDALERPQSEGRTYDLPGGETLTYRTMVARIFEGLGLTPRILPVSPALWSLGLRVAAPFLPGATSAMGARMDQDLAFDPGPAARDLGWRPRAFRPRFEARFGARFGAPVADGAALR